MNIQQICNPQKFNLAKTKVHTVVTRAILLSPAHRFTLHSEDYIQKYKLFLLNLCSLWAEVHPHYTETASSLIHYFCREDAAENFQLFIDTSQ